MSASQSTELKEHVFNCPLVCGVGDSRVGMCPMSRVPTQWWRQVSWWETLAMTMLVRHRRMCFLPLLLTALPLTHWHSLGHVTQCSTSPLLPLNSFVCAVFLFGIDAHLSVCVDIRICVATARQALYNLERARQKALGR